MNDFLNDILFKLVHDVYDNNFFNRPSTNHNKQMMCINSLRASEIVLIRSLERLYEYLPALDQRKWSYICAGYERRNYIRFN